MTEDRLGRRIGPDLATGCGVGVTVGAGIYDASGAIAGRAGVRAAVSVLFAGLAIVAAGTAPGAPALTPRHDSGHGRGRRVAALSAGACPGRLRAPGRAIRSDATCCRKRKREVRG